MAKTILIKLVFPISTLVILVFLFSGMADRSIEDESGIQSEIVVPEREKIPHYDRDHIVVDQSGSFEELADPPAELVLLYNYLQDPTRLEKIPLDLMFSGWLGRGFGVESVSSDRLIILSNSQLIEYDLNTHQHSLIAGEGRGPEDIIEAADIMLQNRTIHIACGDMYLSSFDCHEAPCEHVDAVFVDFRPWSIAVGEAHYTVLELGGGSDPLRFLDRSGEQIAAFGDAYDSEEYPILTNYYSRFGQVQYSPSTDLHILSYSVFPYLYIYDSSLELQESYEMADFILIQRIFAPSERDISMPQNDFDRVNNIRVIGDELLLVEKMSVKILSFETENPDVRLRHEFYVLDLEHSNSFYLGGYDRPDQNHSEPAGEQVFVTDFGLVIYDHEEMMLYWAGI